MSEISLNPEIMLLDTESDAGRELPRLPHLGATLEELRGGLLDLSSNNYLLNLPRVESSKLPHQLAFVEANLDRTLKRLRNQDELGIRAVPYPDRDRMISFDEFTNNPETYLDGEEKREVLVGTLSRTRLGAEEYARQLGINTSYELDGEALSGVSVERGGAGDELQVVAFADELERKLIPIRESSRAAARELGLGTLYLIIGFLEWYEPAGEELPRLAPLLLVPVALVKRRPIGQPVGHEDFSPYVIELTGEEIEVNPILQTLIRQQFGMRLPEIGNEESFFSYLERLGPIMEAQPRWQVRHRLTLTNLDLHQLRMWEDLDPSRWTGHRLVGHPLVTDLLTGRRVDVTERDAPSIDEIDRSGQLPPLVHDADSSQQLAIVEALRGESLVIEGAPGTGKSQTIANLIAAALWQGRSVLLVSEGRTALESVRRKLAEAGLEDFALCLGQHCTGDEVGTGEERFISRTREMAHSLRRRLDRRGNWEMPAALPLKREIRADYWRRLHEYESTIQLHYGACGRTIAETLALRESLYQVLASAVSSQTLATIEGLRIERVESLTLAQVEAIEENAGICEQSRQQIAGEALEGAHPWWWLERENLDSEDEQVLLEILQSLVDVTSGINETVTRFNRNSGLMLTSYELSVNQLIGFEPLLPVPDQAMRRDILPMLIAPQTREDFRSLGSWLAEQELILRDLSGNFSSLPELEFEDLDRLQSACRRAAELGLDQMTIDQLRHCGQWMKSLSNHITKTGELFSQLNGFLGCELSFNLTSVRSVARALILLNELPLSSLSSRVPGLEREGVGPVLTRARQEAEQIRNLADRLARRIDRRLAPSVEDLTRYVVAAANAGPLSFVSRDFREARREWLGMVIPEDARNSGQMARDFRNLLEYQTRFHDFITRSEYLQVLGSIFQGLETPFGEYDELVKWYDRIRLIIGQGSDPARRVARALFTAPVASLKALVHFKDGEAKDEVEDFISFYNQFDELEPAIPNIIRAKGRDDLARLAERLGKLAEICQSIENTFTDLEIETEARIEEVRGSLDQLYRLNELRRMIGSRHDLATLLGAARIDSLVSFKGVAEAIGFVERLESSALPVDYRRWLCAADVDHRLELIKWAIHCVDELHRQYLETRNRFSALTGIDEAEWFGADNSTGETSFKQIKDVENRARRALAATDELPIWLIARRSLKMMASQGLFNLAEMFANGQLRPGSLVEAVQFVYHNSILAGALRNYPQLLDFNGVVLDETRRRFASTDQEILKLNQQEIAARLDNQHIPPGNRIGPATGHTELGLITHLVGNPDMNLSIREVIKRSAGALIALKPCFIMSPHSVARYLPPELIRFDLVIIDEASRMRPEVALGAIARGGQLVVVGDRLYLPPARRSNAALLRNGTDGSEIENKLASRPATTDLPESILEMASLCCHSICQLRWHYRSSHESLISFVNREFYQGRLVAFPSSPGSQQEDGVFFRLVEDGVWIESTNRGEARQVVAATIDHLLNRPGQSLGVIALSLPQRDLILELLEQALRDNPAAARAYQYWQGVGEVPFVSSLETLQGDERDVIFISGTAGPDPQGQFRIASCGQLNNIRHGHRLLNVMVSRARQRLVCFSSIRSTGIGPGPNAPWGIRAWCDFLSYIEAGSVQARKSGPPRSELAPGTRFRLDVVASLRARGIRALLKDGNGVGLVELDLSSNHQPAQRPLVLDCDLESVNSGGSISDRHRLRPQLLEGRGWAIHQLWAIEWTRSRDQETNRIIAKLAN